MIGDWGDRDNGTRQSPATPMTKRTRIRQVVLATNDLDAAVDIVTDAYDLVVSHRVEDAPSHAEFALRAAMIPFGNQFLEIVQPTASDVPVARHLDRLGCAGGYMVILEAPSLAEARSRVEALGLSVIWQGTGGGGVEAIHLHPRDTGGTLLSLASPLEPGTWSQGGAGWEAKVRTGIVAGIAGIEIASRAPEDAARRWAAILGLDNIVPGQVDLDLADGKLRFVTAKGVPHGPAAIIVRAAGAPVHELTIGAFTVRGEQTCDAPPGPPPVAAHERM